MAQNGSAVDPGGLMEFSVVFTDRSLNHMSKAFQKVMNDISDMLKEVYGADGVAVVPGGGTYAMEAVARQLAHGRDLLRSRTTLAVRSRTSHPTGFSSRCFDHSTATAKKYWFSCRIIDFTFPARLPNRAQCGLPAVTA